MYLPRITLTFSVLALVFVPAAGHAQASARGAMPGMIETPEGSVYMACSGEAQDGIPTVVFENGLGDGYATWSGVQPVIAEIARTCAYDRLGAGQSDPVPESVTRSPFELVETLRAALSEAGEPGPYVLVGHSIAGLILLAYPHLHPEEVAGLVFLTGLLVYLTSFFIGGKEPEEA